MRSLPLALSLALLLLVPLRADEPLTPQETTALKRVEKELLDLSKFAAKGKDHAAARRALELGLLVWPESPKLKSELAKLEKGAPKGTPADGFADKLAEQEFQAREDVAMALAEAAVAVAGSHPARHERYVRLVQERFPSKPALRKLDLAWFAPYYRWVSGSEARLLESGGEVHDGKRLEPGEVAALDRAHAGWDDPWVISDEVHEVRTTMPLRVAKQVLHFVAAYRRHFLERFGPLWDLKPPAGKLPLIVTRSQADLRARLEATARALGGQVPQMQGAAYYLFTNQALNPCFVTYEPVDATGTQFRIERFEQLVIPLVHEVTHQLAFEYSKHEVDATRTFEHHFWSVEAIANFMGYHVYDGTTWRLTRPRTIPMGRGVLEGPFAWCVAHKGSLPPLARFMAQSQQQFLTVENYHIAATLAWFLLEGEGGKYRQGFVKLLQAIHRVRDHPDLFARSFPGVDIGAMEREWLAFVGRIELDD